MAAGREQILQGGEQNSTANRPTLVRLKCTRHKK